jgi:hypothetical protein
MRNLIDVIKKKRKKKTSLAKISFLPRKQCLNLFQNALLECRKAGDRGGWRES